MNRTIFYTLIATALFIQMHHYYAAEVNQPTQQNDVYTRPLIVRAENGDSLELSPVDLAALRSEYLKQLAAPEHELSVASIALLPIATVRPLQLLLSGSRLARARYDDVVEATSLADLLVIPNGVDYFLKRLGRENIKLLCQLYQDPGLDGRELVKDYISPYLPSYKLTQRLGVVNKKNLNDGHVNWIDSVVLSPDGNTIISGSHDHTIIVWHCGEDGKFRFNPQRDRLGVVNNTDDHPDVGHTGAVVSVALSADGKTIISSSFDHTLIIWHRGEDGQFRFDPQRDRLGVVGNRRSFDVGHTNLVYSVALSQDSKTIISGSADHTLIVWHRGEDGLFHMAQRLGAVGNRNLVVGHTNWIDSVVLSADGNTIMSGSHDHTIIIWHRGEDGQFRFDPQRDRLGAVGNTRDHPNVGHTDVVISLALSPDGNTIISGSGDHTLIIWHRGEDGLFYMAQRLGAVDNTNPDVGHTGFVSSAALSPDGNTIISSSSDRTIIVWHRGEDGQFRFDSQRDRLGAVNNGNTDVGHTDTIYSVTLSPDGNTIISGSVDHTVIVWHKQSVDEFCVAQVATNGPQASEAGI